MAGKNTYKPASIKRGTYTQMFLDSDRKHFIDAISELTYNEVLGWGGRKHSEFMAPYLNDEYPTMDYLWPDISLNDDPNEDTSTTTYRYGPGGGGGGDGGGAGGVDPYIFQCIISCERVVYDCSKRDPLKCWYGAVTGEGIIGNWSVIDFPDTFKGLTFMEGSGTVDVLGDPGEKWINSTTDDNKDYWLTIQYTDLGSERDGWYYHPGLGRWIYILSGSSTCTAEVHVRCEECEQPLVFDDDSTPDTIDPDDSISLYLSGGLGPYAWSVAGAGHTLDNDTTDTPNNILNCVAGSCGVEFAAYATVTVQDYCGNTVSFVIRNSTGQWSHVYNLDARVISSCDGCGGNECTCYSGSTEAYYTDGYQKWYYASGSGDTKAPVQNDTCNNWCISGSPASSAYVPPPCPTPRSVIYGTCHVDYECYPQTGWYQEWKCP